VKGGDGGWELRRCQSCQTRVTAELDIQGDGPLTDSGVVGAILATGPGAWDTIKGSWGCLTGLRDRYSQLFLSGLQTEVDARGKSSDGLVISK
jgi:hypothetical protein